MYDAPARSATRGPPLLVAAVLLANGPVDASTRDASKPYPWKALSLSERCSLAYSAVRGCAQGVLIARTPPLESYDGGMQMEGMPAMKADRSWQLQPCGQMDGAATQPVFVQVPVAPVGSFAQ